MKLFKKLYDEIHAERNGTYAPYYYKYLGFMEDINASPATLRANGTYALFTLPQPIIHTAEWIAGNRTLLYCEEDPFILENAKRVTDHFGERTFLTNNDHYAPGYARAVKLGIPGLFSEIDASLQKHAGDAEKCEYLRAMRHTLCGFSKMIENYAAAAKAHKGDPAYSEERLDFIIENCTALVNYAPQSFAQALQLVFFCHVAFCMENRGAMALGRIDQYLYPFYAADIQNGALTKERAIELLENTFIKLAGGTINICIGGQDVHGNCQINELSYCVLRAVGNCNIPGPNLSLRLTENTPDEFLDECLKVIGTGLGYPALMNDDINIAALSRYGYDKEDIYDYCMVGCIENFLPGKQPPWSDGRFDAPRYFDYVFNNGRSDTNKSFGLDTGNLNTITSMADFMERFEKQLTFGVADYCARFNKVNASINQAYFPSPFLSCFCDDCIDRGLDINNGGSKYPSVHGAGLMGIGTVSDSLAAIEKVVFVDKAATLTDIKNALNSNFEGYEALREKLLAAPKYGNNDDFVDKYAVWYLSFLSKLFMQYKTRDGGGFYTAAAANINNIYAGQIINATPDGRKRHEPLSDAASPTYGRDVKGPTAVINSVCKPDYSVVACGTVVNQKYSPSMFSDEKRGKLLALIRTYFKKGGQEIQINATSREVLEDAMEHPENYQSLVVRVSGFSAFYVSLEKEVQLDILHRTQQE